MKRFILIFTLASLVTIGLGSCAPSTTEADPTTEAAAMNLAERGVSSNAEWEPFIRTFEGVEMALIPERCLPMGGEGSSEACLTQPYWIDVKEVSNSQFATFDSEAARESFNTEGNHARDTIRWSEADSFCESRGARLPTEAEWAYASRGPDGLVYPWGNGQTISRFSLCQIVKRPAP